MLLLMKRSNSWPVDSTCVTKVLVHVDSTVEDMYIVAFWLFTPFCIIEVTECQLLRDRELNVYMKFFFKICQLKTLVHLAEI
jgi:hypothetical protein